MMDKEIDASKRNLFLKGSAGVAIGATLPLLVNSNKSYASTLPGQVCVTDFGADSTGLTDSSSAIQSAINSLPSNGGIVYFPAGIYLISSTITIGNGSSSSISTINSVALIGASGGVGAGEYGTNNSGVILRWNGSASGTALRFNGPIHSCVMKYFTIDAITTLAIGIDAWHLYQCEFEKVSVQSWTSFGFRLRARDSASLGGTSQGFMENRFIGCIARNPGSSAAAYGFELTGGWNHNVGFSRNVFLGCTSLIPGASTSAAFYIRYIDNNTFIECFAAYAFASPANGYGVVMYVDGAFPLENCFLNCPIVGGISVLNGIGGNNFWLPYPTSDAEPFPNWQANKLIAADGRMRGGWSGSKVLWSGRSDPGIGLTSAPRYYHPSGQTAGLASSGAHAIAGSGVKLCSFRANIGTAPGLGNSRTATVYVNGSATPLTLTFNSTDLGDKRIAFPSGYDVNGGIGIEIVWTITGFPANANAMWALEFYPLEVD